MKVTRAYDFFGNDCTMDTVCEHCGAKHKDTAAYNDYNYIHNVVPARYCKKCDKNCNGELKPNKQNGI